MLGMRWIKTLQWVGSVGMLMACSTKDEPPVLENGQIGSPGYGCNQTECDASGPSWEASLAETSVPTYVGSSCREGSAQASAEERSYKNCACERNDGKTDVIEATGVAQGGTSGFVLTQPPSDGGSRSVVATEPCLAWGRGHLACIYPASANTACSPDDADSCTAICERLRQGYAEDAARSYDVELRGSACYSPSGDAGAGRCAVVARIDGSCYVTGNAGFFDPQPYDCALSDEQIRRQQYGAPSGGGGGGSGGTGQ